MGLCFLLNGFAVCRLHERKRNYIVKIILFLNCSLRFSLKNNEDFIRRNENEIKLKLDLSKRNVLYCFQVYYIRIGQNSLGKSWFLIGI